MALAEQRETALTMRYRTPELSRWNGASWKLEVHFKKIFYAGAILLITAATMLLLFRQQRTPSLGDLNPLTYFHNNATKAKDPKIKLN